MFAKHDKKLKNNDLSYKQSAWASAKLTERLDSEMAVSLRVHLHEEFLAARSWFDLRRRLIGKGFYLTQAGDSVRLRDAYSDVDICSCSFLGFPSAKLTSRFALLRAASGS
jgi:hypothetical protein